MFGLRGPVYYALLLTPNRSVYSGLCQLIVLITLIMKSLNVLRGLTPVSETGIKIPCKF